MKVSFARQWDIKPFKAEIIISSLAQRARELNFEPEFKIIVTERAKHFVELEDHEILSDKGKDLLFYQYLTIFIYIFDQIIVWNKIIFQILSSTVGRAVWGRDEVAQNKLELWS